MCVWNKFFLYLCTLLKQKLAVQKYGEAKVRRELVNVYMVIGEDVR